MRYFGGRWYDPEIGRFITVDPAEDGENWYGSCGGHPINYVDPDGRFTNIGQLFYYYLGALDYGVNLVLGLSSFIDKISAFPQLNLIPGGSYINFTIFAIQFNIAVFKNPSLFLRVASQMGNAFIEDIVYYVKNVIPVVFGKPSNAEVRRFGQAAMGTVLTIFTAIDLAQFGINSIRKTVPSIVKSKAPLEAGRQIETETLSEMNLAKNSKIWRPTNEDIFTSTFRVIVGEAKYTENGLLKGTIFDSVENGNLEIKSGQSALNSSYQLRLQVYRSLQTKTPLTIKTSRPLSKAFEDLLRRWGVRVESL